MAAGGKGGTKPPRRRNDLVGVRFGCLVAQSIESCDKVHTYWKCLCVCGRSHTASRNALKRGLTKSCGCQKGRFLSEKNATHGKSRHPAYKCFIGMKRRCADTKHKMHKFYASKGIQVKWKSFEDFWDDMGPTWRRGLSIDRVNNDGHYEKGNCRWATAREQANNTSRTVFLTLGSETLTATEWIERLGIPRYLVFDRIKRGWSDEEVLTTPKGKYRATGSRLKRIATRRSTARPQRG